MQPLARVGSGVAGVNLMSGTIASGTVLRACRAGCPPCWQYPVPEGLTAAQVDAAVNTAVDAVLAVWGPGRTASGQDWQRHIWTCGVLAGHGALSPDRARRWASAPSGLLDLWAAATPAGAGLAAWLDQAWEWALAGCTVADGTDWWALAPGDPRRPDRADLAVMSGLLVLAGPTSQAR